MFIVFAGILACTLTSEQPVPSPEEMRDVEVLSQRETLLRPLYTLDDSVEDVVPFRGPEEDALLGLLIRWDDSFRSRIRRTKQLRRRLLPGAPLIAS